MMQFRVHGKGGKIRFVPVYPRTLSVIYDYLEKAGHREDAKGPLFRPVKNIVTGELAKPLYPRLGFPPPPLRQIALLPPPPARA